MNRFLLILITSSLLLFCSEELQSQDTINTHKKVSLDNTEQFTITSEYVKGETYTIQVGLPASYSYKIKKTYPVLYVLDGDKSFGMTKEITDWLEWSGEIKEVIIVAITYGKGTAVWWNKRARDYTQYKDTVYYYYPNAGGSDNFLGFMQNELFPKINGRYRTSQDSSTLMGISFGGLLSSYTLFAHPDMFKSYIIIAPALFWNNNSILNTEACYYSVHKNLNKQVYLAYGTFDNHDWTIDPTDEFIHAVQAHNYEGLKFTTEILKGETHISSYPIAMTHGLKLIFRPNGHQ